MNEPSAAIDAGKAEALLFDLGRVVLHIDWEPGFAHWSRAAGTDVTRAVAPLLAGHGAR